MTLTSETCEACRADSPKVTEEEIRELKPQIPEWEMTEVRSVPHLRRTFRFDGWMPAVRFVDALAELVEEQDHHPVIRLEWGKLTVSWWTHAIDGLHRNDFIMAARTDEIYGKHSE
ncbi:MAG TPA: 4a-hydroxytetrahydrobiopterin dehydratase [Thermomicrobiales bacterium]|nr:4a-hydroxytetrahydrobiopterin dehydratase [Thermomicrobiales bacterium]